MFGAPTAQIGKVINLELSSEANNNGYLDFFSDYNSFKVTITNSENVNMSNVKYSWSVVDAS